MRTVKVIFKIDLVNVLLGFSQNFLAINIMNPLSWFMMVNTTEVTKGGEKSDTRVNRLRNNVFVNPPPLPLLCEISGAVHLAQPGLTAGWLAGKST